MKTEVKNRAGAAGQRSSRRMRVRGARRAQKFPLEARETSSAEQHFAE